MAKRAVTKKRATLSGPVALFRNKERSRPTSVLFTKAHHAKLARAQARLNLSRCDVLSLLVEQFAEVVQIPRDLPSPSDE